ncbi:MAG: winged helix-turn-helix domain-containing protein [Candidatus Woesearchaeota archaeon]
MKSEYELKQKSELSSTKLKILKLIAIKPRTLTELSELLSIAKPSVLEHLRILEEKHLIEREETDRKWKYYQLTLEGKRLLRNLSLVDIYSNIFISAMLGTFWTILNFLPNKTIQKQEVKRVLVESFSVREPSVSQNIPLILEKITFVLFIISLISLIILIIWKYSRYKKLKNIEV